MTFLTNYPNSSFVHRSFGVCVGIEVILDTGVLISHIISSMLLIVNIFIVAVITFLKLSVS